MTRYASQNYDMSCVFFTKERQSGFDEVDLAEEDSLELGADEILSRGISRELFDCANDRC